LRIKLEEQSRKCAVLLQKVSSS